VPTPNALVMEIAPGHDGNLWFTEYSGNKIGKITTAGLIAEYPIPTAHGDSEGISSGADGNMWFVETASGNVGKITPAGVITEYPFPNTPWENPGAQIVSGPDGNMWFTFGGTNTVDTVRFVDAPVASMTFSPSILKVNGTNSGPSVMTVTLTNPNSSTWLTDVAFTDVFPSGLYGTALSTSCGGTLAPSAQSFTFAKLSGASIPPNGSCWVSVDMYANATGRLTNSTGPVTTGNALTGAAASAVITVLQTPPPPPHCTPIRVS